MLNRRVMPQTVRARRELGGKPALPASCCTDWPLKSSPAEPTPTPVCSDQDVEPSPAASY